jgi:hypothetical protein
VGAADLEVVEGIGSVNVTLVELPEDLLKKQLGEAFCDLLFLIATSQSKRSPLVEGFRRPSLRSGLLNPRPRESYHNQITCLLLNSHLSPFVPAPTQNYERLKTHWTMYRVGLSVKPCQLTAALFLWCKSLARMRREWLTPARRVPFPDLRRPDLSAR